MVDTIRDRTSILALFPDNTTGDISPQDLRDFVVSAWGVYGGIGLTAGAYSQAAGTTPQQLTCFSTSSGVAKGVTEDAANDKLTPLSDGVYIGFFSASFSGGNARTFTFEWYVNGSTTGYEMERKMGSGGDIGAGAFFFIGTISANQDVEIYISCDQDAQTVDIKHAQMGLLRLS